MRACYLFLETPTPSSLHPPSTPAPYRGNYRHPRVSRALVTTPLDRPPSRSPPPRCRFGICFQSRLTTLPRKSANKQQYFGLARERCIARRDAGAAPFQRADAAAVGDDVAGAVLSSTPRHCAILLSWGPAVRVTNDKGKRGARGRGGSKSGNGRREG